MKAALIRELGAVPDVAEVDEPSGEVVEVLAAPINPIDLATSRGLLAAGHPELPYVPGCEAVGRTADGRLVWIFGAGLGLSRNGAMAARAAVGDLPAIEVPDGADPALAAALGIAGLAGWLPFAWRAPLRGGENVLVLGATGSVGLVAVQRRSSSAPHASSRRAGALRAWSEPRRWGRMRPCAWTRRMTSSRRSRTPLVATARATSSTRFGGLQLAAAVQAAVPWATIVNLGQSAGATSELASAAVRFKSLAAILGHTNFAVPADQLADHYRRLVGHAVAGEIQLEVERVPLGAVADVWRRQAEGAGTKLVLVP